MSSTEKNNTFSYWKRPWGKWAILAAAILQILILLMNIREYHEYNGIFKAGFFDASEWEDYVFSTIYRCTMNGIAAFFFGGVFFIGVFAKSQRTAWLAESVLLFVFSFMCGISGLILHLFSLPLWGFILLCFLITGLGGGFYYLWKYKRTAAA